MNAQQRAEWQAFCTTPEAQDELMRAWAEDAAELLCRDIRSLSADLADVYVHDGCVANLREARDLINQAIGDDNGKH
jgi:hypothetical protein